MADPFIGEIRIFGFNFAPLDWAFCDGGVADLRQYQALYSIIGNSFGGSLSQSTFGFPNLQGMAVMNQGQGPGLTNRPWAVAGGAPTVPLTISQMAPHNHSVVASFPVTGADTGISAVPTTLCTLACEQTDSLSTFGEPTGTITALAPNTIGPSSGAGTAHPNMQPYLALNFCISLSGEYPVRPS